MKYKTILLTLVSLLMLACNRAPKSVCTPDRQAGAVIALIGQAYARAKELLEQDRAAMDRLSAYLLEKETITGEEFMEILDRKEGQPESLG